MGDNKVVVSDYELLSFSFVNIILSVKSHQVDLARRQILRNQEVAHVSLLDSVDVFVNPGDLFSHENRLSSVFIAKWQFFTFIVLYATVMETQGFKTACVAATHIQNVDFGFSIINGLDCFPFQNALNRDLVLFFAEQILKDHVTLAVLIKAVRFLNKFVFFSGWRCHIDALVACVLLQHIDRVAYCLGMFGVWVNRLRNRHLKRHDRLARGFVGLLVINLLLSTVGDLKNGTAFVTCV